MEHLFVLAIAFGTAALALPSGFGLGTVLTPVFAIFYEVKTAVFLVAVVHLANNGLKLFLFRKHIDFGILKRFGALAIVGAFVGAFGQAYMAGGLLKKLLGVVLMLLAGRELIPSKFQFRFPKTVDPIGGFFSGLIGGLVGNQGAIRSAFLLNYDIPKETFIATGVVLACIIDLTRIPVYWISYAGVFSNSWQPLLILILVTFLGTFFGTWLLKRISLPHFKKFVAVFIFLMGVYFLF